MDASAHNLDPALAKTSLDWLSRILWPDGSGYISGGQPCADGRPCWYAAPSTTEPDILIPTAPAAARRAVRRYHDGFSVHRRLRSLTAEVAMAQPHLAQRLLQKRTVIAVGPQADGGLIAAIGEALGIPNLQTAVSLARPKTNRKPVLQLFDREGHQYGWAKIGWNDWTKTLVGNEALWLTNKPLPPLAMPSLLHDLEIDGRRVVISSGFAASRLPSRRPATVPAMALFEAIASVGDPATATPRPVAEGAWYRSVIDVLDAAEPAEIRAVEAVLTGAADQPLRLGTFHGDLNPWNMMTANGTYQVIDWEFTAAQAPIGFDLCHFHTQVGSEMLGLSTPDSLAHSARLSPQGLWSLGIAPEHQLLVFRLYLVELVRRTLALRARGLDTSAVHQGKAALVRLERLDHCSQLPVTHR